MLVTLAFTVVPAISYAETCILTIQEEVQFEGPCDFEFTTDNDGSFAVDDGNKPLFAMLFVTGKDTGIGYWNEYETRAHSSLGELRRVGGCWTSDFATLCAWQ